MYTGKPLPKRQKELEEDWVAGGVWPCKQSWLHFGSDRRKPVHYRPAVEVRRDGEFVVVLPCTSVRKSSLEFYELTPAQVMWVQPRQASSFVYYRYEVVQALALQQPKMGGLGHPARLDMMRWLRERWA